MRANIVNIVVLALIIAFSIWLYGYDEAAMPNDLSSAHDAFGDCRTCHVPWKGVDNWSCLQCHPFDEVTALKPQIRFHEAGKHCLSCHTEHRGSRADISEMDHTLLNGALECTQCHVDPHGAKFGNDCRACHGITEWQVEGFRHPAAENRNCSRCHPVPESHLNDAFWEKIREGHQEQRLEQPLPTPKECWRCHITHRWDHLRMTHDL